MANVKWCVIQILFLIIIKFGNAIDTSEIICTEDFCREVQANGNCDTIDPKCYNESIAIMWDSATECNCCETCLMFQNKGDPCQVGMPGAPLPSAMCGPGLTCNNGVCAEMDASVTDPLQFKNYECYNGLCQCVFRDNNGAHPVYGEFSEDDVDLNQIQCLCSTLSYKADNLPMKTTPFDGYQLFARCLPNGQFDPLQCIDRACFCVDPNTGVFDEFEEVPKIPIELLGPGRPTCFDAVAYNHTKEYFRPCEKAMRNLLLAKEFAEAEGYEFLFPFHVKCLPNGEFQENTTPQLLAALKALERTSGNEYLKK